MNANGLHQTVENLAEKIQFIYSPDCSNEARSSIYKEIETMKSDYILSLRAGFELIRKENLDVVRNFGYQLIEDAIKYFWNDIPLSEKVSIKEGVFRHISQEMKSLQDEKIYLKTSVSKLVVEIMKREFPQHWPTLGTELEQLAATNALCAQVVLLILKQVSEDVIVLRLLDGVRRKEIQQALVENLHWLMALFQRPIQLMLQTKAENDEELNQLLSTCLQTLNVYLEWIHLKLIEETGILRFCSLLLHSAPAYRAASLGCLMTVVERKGTHEEKKTIIKCVTEMDVFEPLVACCLSCSPAPDESTFHLLLSATSILVSVGELIGDLSNEDYAPPAVFPQLVTLLAELVGHPSHSVSFPLLTMWLDLLDKTALAKSPVVNGLLPQLLQTLQNKLLKVGLPSRHDSVSCRFSQFEFDDDEAFLTFFATFRNDAGLLVKKISNLIPGEALRQAIFWAEQVLAAPIQTTAEGAPPASLCTQYSPSYLQWDSMATFLECAVQYPRKNKNTKVAEAFTPQGLRLLGQLVSFTTGDALLLSTTMSAISPLTYLLSATESVLFNSLVDKLLSAIDIPHMKPNDPRRYSCRLLQSHACSSFLNLCTAHPLLLLPRLNDLVSYIMTLLNQAGESLQTSILIEAAVILTNELTDTQSQRDHLTQLLGPLANWWRSPEFSQAITRPELFAEYMGIMDWNTALAKAGNRKQCHLCLRSMDSIARRLKAAKTSGDPYDMIAGELLRPLLDNIFRYIRVSNALYSIRGQMTVEVAATLELSENEKLQILGLNAPPSNRVKSDAVRMQHFVHDTFGFALQFLNSFVVKYGAMFFSGPSLAEPLLKTLYYELESLPLARIRLLIRGITRNIVTRCPVERYNDHLMPLLPRLLEHCFRRINEGWLKIQQVRDSEEEVDVFEEELVRLFARDLLDLVVSVCVQRAARGASEGDADMMEPKCDGETLSELALRMLAQPDGCVAIVTCVFEGLCWGDTGVDNRCARLLPLLVRHMVAFGNLSEDDAVYLVTGVLRGVRCLSPLEDAMHLLVAAALTVYETLRPKFAAVKNVLVQIPGCQANAVDKLDAMILSVQPNAKPPVKKKKDSFKKMLSGLMEEDIHLRYRKPVFIKNLPPMLSKKAAKLKLHPVASDEEPISLAGFFQPSS